MPPWKNTAEILIGDEKYYEVAKLFKMRSLPPDELKPPVEEKVEEEEDPKKKKLKNYEKNKKNSLISKLYWMN